MIENLDQFLKDFGVLCRLGQHDFLGLLDQGDETLEIGHGKISAQQNTLTVKTSDIALGLKNGAVLIIDGAIYTQRGPANRLDDGAFSSLQVAKQ